MKDDESDAERLGRELLQVKEKGRRKKSRVESKSPKRRCTSTFFLFFESEKKAQSRKISQPTQRSATQCNATQRKMWGAQRNNEKDKKEQKSRKAGNFTSCPASHSVTASAGVHFSKVRIQKFPISPTPTDIFLSAKKKKVGV